MRDLLDMYILCRLFGFKRLMGFYFGLFVFLLVLMLITSICSKEEKDNPEYTEAKTELTFGMTSIANTAEVVKADKTKRIKDAVDVDSPITDTFVESKSSVEKNVHYFELSTVYGVIKLYVGIPKDSVQSLMGHPHSVRVTDMGILGVNETWEYMGRNKYTSEFTIMFNNEKLISLHQYIEK